MTYYDQICRLLPLGPPCVPSFCLRVPGKHDHQANHPWSGRIAFSSWELLFSAVLLVDVFCSKLPAVFVPLGPFSAVPSSAARLCAALCQRVSPPDSTSAPISPGAVSKPAICARMGISWNGVSSCLAKLYAAPTALNVQRSWLRGIAWVSWVDFWSCRGAPWPGLPQQFPKHQPLRFGTVPKRLGDGLGCAANTSFATPRSWHIGGKAPSSAASFQVVQHSGHFAFASLLQ